MTLKAGRGAILGPLLVAIVGCALVVAGVFITDPSLGYPPGTPPGPSVTTTWHGFIHSTVGALGFFIGLPGACFVFAVRFARKPSSRAWSIYSAASAVLMLASFIGFGVASNTGGPAGLFERIAISIGLAWIAILAAGLWRQTPDSSKSAI
jgi:hypothetical protein